MGINRSGYLKWAEGAKLKAESERRRDECIALIHEVWDRHRSHGYRWVREAIAREFGVEYRKPKEESVAFPRMLKRPWTASRYLEKAVSDMTVLKHRGGRRYELPLYIDVFSKAIVSYGISKTPGDRRTYLDGLRKLGWRIEKEQSGLVTTLHTDQGAVYSSRSYDELLKKYNIIHSMSRKGTPTDNPMDESLNGWIKDELYVDFGFYRCEDPIKCVKQYVKYYNNERLSYALDYKTPAEHIAQSG